MPCSDFPFDLSDTHFHYFLCLHPFISANSNNPSNLSNPPEMAKGTRGRRGIASRQCRPTPYPLPSCGEREDMQQMNCSKVMKKDWEDATCSVCMECPHKAVLLLCSSHDKGCRPYMCGTSFRYSNCLDQYKKAYTKPTLSRINLFHDSPDNQVIDPFSGQPVDNCGGAELACPLCRGQVKGCTVVEPAREHHNAKKRCCMQENCTFAGTFKELRKHVRADHPSAKPREVDPTLEQKWRRMEREQEREDVMSTIRTSMPGAVFFGDYVIEGGHYEFDSDEEEGFDLNSMERNEDVEVDIDRNLMSVFLFLQAFGSTGNAGSNRGTRRQEREPTSAPDRGSLRTHPDNTVNDLDIYDQYSDDNDDDNGIENEGNSGRVILRRSGRRRRRREEANQERR